MKTWSKHQNAIFDFVENGAGNAIVEAVAGSGKTTTIVEAIKHVVGTTLFLAFNKSIAEELKARGVNARTFHSLTFGIVKEKLGGQMDADKVRKLVDTYFTTDEKSMYGSYCSKLLGLGKQSGVACLVPDAKEIWQSIADHHDLELEAEAATEDRAFELVSELLQWNNKSPNFDFDDMLYMPVLLGLSLPKWDFIFVDEAQDTNAIQRALLKKLFKKNTRMVAVGDPAQAIYGFRGADSDSLDMIAKEFGAITLPLSVSYRCSTSIVEYARNWVKHIEPSPTAKAGSVHDHGYDWQTSMFKAEDLVVCRTTKPIIAMAYQLINARIPAFVMGREIGAGLKSLIKKLNPKNLPELDKKLVRWAERETKKLEERKQEEKIQAIQDKCECLQYLMDQAKSLSDLNTIIDDLFSDKKGAVKLATIHKSKGLEAERVFWLNRSACPSKWAKQDWQKKQEENLCYVATTRAISELHMIDEQKRS